MNLKLALLLVLTVMVGIFLIQNLMIVEITFMFWSFEMSRALLCFTILLIGIITGWLIGSFARRD